MPDGNPYARIVSVMQTGAAERTEPVKMYLGAVTQREPLEVIVAGTRQPAEALRINERLTKGAKWKTKIDAPVDVMIDQAEQEQLEIDLDAGDSVLLLTGDDQVFYIIMKVVDAV